jgi:hypothetical protein
MTQPSGRMRPCASCGVPIPHVPWRPRCRACWAAGRPTQAQLARAQTEREHSAELGALCQAVYIAAGLLGVTQDELIELGRMAEYAIQARREDIARRYHYGRAIPGPEVKA